MKNKLIIFIFKAIIKPFFIFLTISLLCLNSLFSNENKNNKLENTLNLYYQKLDKNLPNLEQRIKKLKKVESKIDNLFILKWKNISKKNNELLMFVKLSILNKIKEYKEKSNLTLNLKSYNKECSYKWETIINWEKKEYKKSSYIPNWRKYFLINYKCSNWEMLELNKKLEYTSCNPWYINKNNWCINKNKWCKLNWLYIKDKIQAWYQKSFIINWWRKYYFVNYECNNWKLLELNRSFRKINCNPWYIKKWKICIKYIN